jgi:hypothetical protein
MTRLRSRTAVALAAVGLAVAGAMPAAAQSPDEAVQAILDWNEHSIVAINGSDAAPAHQPMYMGMVHAAVYDAIVSIAGGARPYLGVVDADPDASQAAAAAQAAHDVLAEVFPDQAATLDGWLEESLAAIDDGDAKDAGIAVGMAAAGALIDARADDGRGGESVITPGTEVGRWRPVPPENLEFPGSWIATVKPFLADRASYYRTEGPYALDSAEYAADFEEVKAMGSAEGSTRTTEQDGMMGFWLSPLVQYSALERTLAVEMGLSATETARLLAMANLASADATIGCFDDKYHWMFWRPTTAIQNAADDGNDATEADPAWASLASPVPPYPDHPSGWNCIAGAHNGALQQYFGTDEMTFQMRHPEMDEPREYTSFTQALQEGIDLRVWQGLHFRNADEQGAQLGLKAAALAAERLTSSD